MINLHGFDGVVLSNDETLFIVGSGSGSLVISTKCLLSLNDLFANLHNATPSELFVVSFV